MAREEFSPKTKLLIAMRAGGRCSNPDCGTLCWLPGSNIEKAINLGEVAHICAASKEKGPRNNNSLTSDEIKSINNAIFLCSNCHTLIDSDEQRFSKEVLYEWRNKHESKIKGLIDGDILFPNFEIEQSGFYTISSEQDNYITSQTMQNRIEKTLRIKNETDFEYRSIGFGLQYPELIEYPPIINTPPGVDYRIVGENMELNVYLSGSASARIPKRTHCGKFEFDANNLLQGEYIEIRLISIPDNSLHRIKYSDKIFWWISGEVKIKHGKSIEKKGFTIPLFFDFEKRGIELGMMHDSKRHKERYVNLHRF